MAGDVLATKLRCPLAFMFAIIHSLSFILETSFLAAMHALFEFALLCFMSFFTMINPIGVIPPFMSMSEGMDAKEGRSLAIKACFTAFIVLILFALGGTVIFSFFSITVDSLRVVGGVLFFILGFDMLQARMRPRAKEEKELAQAYQTDLAITPLAIPFICGPGAITMAILLIKEAHDLPQKLVFFTSIAVVMFTTCLILIGGQRILQILGPSGGKVMMRLMGLIVMVIAVEFFFAGLTPLVREMLMISS